jgi:hypothetical protein
MAWFIYLPLGLVAVALLALAIAALPYVLGWVILFYSWMFA